MKKNLVRVTSCSLNEDETQRGQTFGSPTIILIVSISPSQSMLRMPGFRTCECVRTLVHVHILVKLSSLQLFS